VNSRAERRRGEERRGEERRGEALWEITMLEDMERAAVL